MPRTPLSVRCDYHEDSSGSETEALLREIGNMESNVEPTFLRSSATPELYAITPGDVNSNPGPVNDAVASSMKQTVSANNNQTRGAERDVQINVDMRPKSLGQRQLSISENNVLMEKEDTMKCIFSSALFLGIIIIVIIVAFVLNPQV